MPQKAIRIPQSIDDPIKILIWDVRDFTPVIFCILLGILTDAMGKLLLVGIVAAYFARRFREQQQDGWLIQALYWIGLYPSRTLPNPFVRRYLP